MPGMGIFVWVGDHWFDVVQGAGIVGGLIFTAHSFRVDTRAEHVANLLEITKAHREIWRELYSRPELFRILDPAPDLVSKPMTPEERLFIGFLILHLNASYKAMKNGVFMSPQGLRKDIQQFFSRPMAKAVWEKMKPLQDADFVRFVEAGRVGNRAARYLDSLRFVSAIDRNPAS